MIHLPVIALDDIPCEPLRLLLHAQREMKHIFTHQPDDCSGSLWGYFDPDGDAWAYSGDSAEAVLFSTAEIEALPPGSFLEVER